MPVCGKYEINITANTQEELDRIAEAIYSGYAETVIKQNVLWPQFLAPAVAPAGTGTSRAPGDHGPELKRAVTRSKAGSQPPATPVKKERTTGLIGRGRMGRTQK